MRSDPTALYSLESKSIFATRPISTPDIDTGAPTLRSPILSNLAVTSYCGGPNHDKPRLVVWVVRKNSAAKPSNTNEPVPRFNVRDLRIRTLLQKRCGNQIVQEQNHHGRGNDRASGGSTDA